MDFDEYDIYHDESKEDSFWHVFLFVPKLLREELISKLKVAREVFSGEELSFKDLGSDTSFFCAKCFLSIACSAFQQKIKSQLEPFLVGKTEYSSKQKGVKPLIDTFSDVPRLKIGIFR